MSTTAISRPLAEELREDVRAFGKPVREMIEWVGDLGFFACERLKRC